MKCLLPHRHSKVTDNVDKISVERKTFVLTREMPYVHVVYRSPIMANPTIVHRSHPGILPIQSDFLVDEEYHRRRPRKITEQIPIKMPRYIPQQNYPTRPNRRLVTRSIRYAVPKYSPLIYSIR